MNRKTFVVGLASMLASVRFSRGDSSPSPQAAATIAYEGSRRQAIAMNDLAGNIHSVAHARNLVDEIAKIFSKDLPPMWVTRAARNRVALAEYQAATEPANLVPEERIADVWNQYIIEIHAPEDSLVSAAEIHNLRDASYASSQVLWERGNQNIWTMSNIYAVGPDGKVADGCRALESLRVLYDLARSPEILQGARQRVQKGILVSDSIREYRQKTATGQRKSKITVSAGMRANPVEAAERRYIDERGSSVLMMLAQGWFEELFPA